MSQFEYVSVVVAVIAGLGIVHLLRGIARFIDARGKWKPYWVHLLWTWNVFYSLIAFWWFTWILRDLPVWNLFAFLYILLFAVVRYLQCVVLFPRRMERPISARSTSKTESRSSGSRS